MATLNEQEGTIVARCPGCSGAKSSFEWIYKGKKLGAVMKKSKNEYGNDWNIAYRLFRCGGCGVGGIGKIKYGGNSDYPGSYNSLVWFFPESKERLTLPAGTPKGITMEFREAEKCFENNCFRAAAGLFRSVLDKTMRSNGYKTNQEKNLVKQIDAAASDGIITQSRKKRAHEEIRVLGNDVLHDDWCEVIEEDVEATRHYTQRILEDFYDDRETVLKLLREANRIPEEDCKNESNETK